MKSESQAYSAFVKNCERIRGLVRCADITANQALAVLRNQEPNTDLTEQLLRGDGHSQLTWSWQWFMSKEEVARFDEAQYIRAICEQIVFASYVAIEAYLKSKFEEYFCAKTGGVDGKPLSLSLREISLRDLSEINKKFRMYFGMHISKFEHPDVRIYEEAKWFHPDSVWGGLKRLENLRHELAHEGAFSSAKLITLVDAWSIFEFIHSYGVFFEYSYNEFIYHGRKVKYELPLAVN